MKEKMQEKLRLFAENARTIKKEFTGHDTLATKLAALLYALELKPVDCDAIKQSHTTIKKNTGVFSMFRGNMALCFATMMSLKDDPADYFARTTDVYKILRDAKFQASDFLVVAAYEIAAQAQPEQYENVVARMKAFYDGMKAKGFFRTGQEDYIFSAMLGLSDIDIEDGKDSIEKLYKRFKPEFWTASSVQALAQVLVLSGECDIAIDRILSLRDAMGSHGDRFDRAYTLPTLGVLALLPMDISSIINDIDEARSYLKGQKGFSTWSVSKQALLLFTSTIVASVHAEEIQDGVVAASISTSIVSIIIAQQTAIMVALMASVAASTLAASSN